MQIIPMRDLKNTVEVERRCAEENGPVYVTKNGYGRLVVMDIEYYERTMQKMYEAKKIMEGLEDVKAGRTAAAQHVFFWSAESSISLSPWAVRVCTAAMERGISCFPTMTFR